MRWCEGLNECDSRFGTGERVGLLAKCWWGERENTGLVTRDGLK